MPKLKSLKKNIIEFEKNQYQNGIFKPKSISEAASNAVLISITNCGVLSDFVCSGVVSALNPAVTGLIIGGSAAIYLYKYAHFAPNTYKYK